MVVNHIKIEDEDYLNVEFWQAKNSVERLAEVTRLTVNYYTWLNGFYPDKIEKVVSQRTL